MNKGRIAYFTATASGINVNNFEYQWKKRGSRNLPTGSKVISVNGAVLIIPNLTESDKGQYYCIVTNEWGRSLKSNYLTVNGTHA